MIGWALHHCVALSWVDGMTLPPGALGRSPRPETTIDPRQARLAAEIERLRCAQGAILAAAKPRIRTPLARLQGYAAILGELARAEAVDAETVRRLVKRVSMGTDELCLAIECVLDGARVSLNGADYEMVPLDLAIPLGEALRGLASLVERRELAVRVEGLGGLPKIEGDGQHLMRAWRDILGYVLVNTASAGSIQLDASALDGELATEFDECGGFVRIRVAGSPAVIEEGEGFLAQRARQAIGKKVARNSAGDAERGLVLAKEIVEQHRGRLWAERESRRGPSLQILLPVWSGG
jgi:signal transduction histidine kinase